MNRKVLLRLVLLHCTVDQQKVTAWILVLGSNGSNVILSEFVQFIMPINRQYIGFRVTKIDIRNWRYFLFTGIIIIFYWQVFFAFNKKYWKITRVSSNIRYLVWVDLQTITVLLISIPPPVLRTDDVTLQISYKRFRIFYLKKKSVLFCLWSQKPTLQ